MFSVAPVYSFKFNLQNPSIIKSDLNYIIKKLYDVQMKIRKDEHSRASAK